MPIGSPNIDGSGFGGGGGGGYPAFSISPSQPYNLGQVIAGGSLSITLVVTNTGSDTLTISSVSVTGTGYSTSGITPPVSVAPGSSVSFQVDLATTAIGTYNGTISIAHNASGSPYTGTLTGEAVAAVGGILQVTPPIGSFPNTVTGASSAELAFTLKNIGNAAFNVTGATLATGTQFTISTAPAYPVTLNPGDTTVIGVKFTPNALAIATDTLNIATNLAGSPTAVSLSGLAILLDPVVTVANASRALILCFGGQVVDFEQMSSIDFDSAQASTLIFNGSSWGKPSQEKQMKRLEILYENYGEVTLTVAATTLRPSQGPNNFVSVSDTKKIGTPLADKTERSQWFDLLASGELLEISITRGASAGPAVLTGFVPEWEDMGEKVEDQ